MSKKLTTQEFINRCRVKHDDMFDYKITTLRKRSYPLPEAFRIEQQCLTSMWNTCIIRLNA